MLQVFLTHLRILLAGNTVDGLLASFTRQQSALTALSDRLQKDATRKYDQSAQLHVDAIEAQSQADRATAVAAKIGALLN